MITTPEWHHQSLSDVGMQNNPQEVFVATQSSEGEPKDPLKIANFLTEFVKAKRTESNLAVLQKDPSLALRIRQYYVDRDDFLRKPPVLQIGEDMLKTQSQIELLGHIQDEQVKFIDDQMRELNSKREQALFEQRALETRIVGIGKRRSIEPDDVWLLLGRIQVKLEELKQKGRLSFWGRMAAKVVGTNKIHPALHPIIDQQEKLSNEKDQLTSERKALFEDDDGFFARQIREKTKLTSLGETLFRELDDWATTGLWDRFIVHFSLYPERRFMLLQQYRSSHPDEWPQIIQELRNYNLLPEQFERFLKETRKARTAVTSRLSKVDQNQKIIPVIMVHSLVFQIGGKELMAVTEEEITQGLFEMTGGPADIGRDRFERLKKDLLRLVSLENPLELSGVKKLKGGPKVYENVGGEYVIVRGRLRTNFSIGIHNDQSAIFVTKTGPRTNRTYGRWD